MILLESEIEELHRVIITINEMLRDRGYKFEQSIDLTLKQFKEKLQNAESLNDLNLIYLAENENFENSQILIVLCDVDKVGVQEVKTYLYYMQNEKASDMIIVLKQDITAFGKKVVEEAQRTTQSGNDNIILKLEETQRQNFKIELFKREELIVNITKHRLSPKYFRINETQKIDLIKSTNFQLNQFPRILKTDPISRYFGLKKGDLLRIERQESNIDCQPISFRVVV